MVKTITYEDKSSPVHLYGVLKRHLDPPAVRLIHRTPTLLRRFGVLTYVLCYSRRNDARSFVGELYVWTLML